jgi:hypothetical protein
MNNPLAGIDPTGYAAETITFDPDNHILLKDSDGNMYVDDGSDSVLSVDSTKSVNSNGTTLVQNFGSNGNLTSLSVSKGDATFSITDIGSQQQSASLQVGSGSNSQSFEFTSPTANDHVAGEGENISSSIMSFLSGGKDGNWFYTPSHEVSKRMMEHSALSPYKEVYENGSNWLNASSEDKLIQNFRRQHTTYLKDFMVDVATIMGAWSEGWSYADFGTNSLGSFSVRGQMVFDRVSNMKSLNVEIYNRWSILSLTRNPFTREPMKTDGMKSVDMYIQISMYDDLR